MKIKKSWNWLKYLNEINHGLLNFKKAASGFKG